MRRAARIGSLPAMGSFDVTLFEALVSAGVSPERARAVVDELERTIDGRHALHSQVLATKRDPAELERRMNERISDLGAVVTSRFSSVDLKFASIDTRFQAVETKIADVRTDIVRWMLTALTAQTALLLGAMKLL
jgi:polyhydroxyalkanoate synthesis regulator phasin